MTADVTRRSELCSIDSQAKAKQITAAFDAKATLDWLKAIGVDYIALTGDRGCIDVANNPDGLVAAINAAQADLETPE